ncbi:MAG: ROK family protein [Xanthomonadaceae bacterium]|nr:ROK family protein [Rhodospirillaceae bacterium]NIA18080.1 ROK family protein [Xanthomonadaceae bacterium]
MRKILAIDIGATKIRAGLVSKNKILILENFKTDLKANKQKFLNDLNTIAKKFISKEIKGIGISWAGQVNWFKGTTDASPFFKKGIKNFPLKKYLEKKYNLPVAIDNDGHCFALAEAIYGAGKKYQNIIGVAIGTDLGGGIIINKKIYRGFQNITAEFSHFTIDKSSKIRCSCGKTGHFASLASGSGMIKLYKEKYNKKISTQQIYQDYKNKDKKAIAIIQEIAENLGIGFAGIITILNPDILILGGGLLKIKPLFNLTKKQTIKNLPFTKLKKVKISKAKLNYPHLVGAGLLLKSNNVIARSK